MRLRILVSGAALALSACGGNEATQNQLNVDSDLTAERIVANDTTAIDAATNDAANMAEDVTLTAEELNALQNNTGDAMGDESDIPQRPAGNSAD